MRINLTKKDIINSAYLQLGFPKKIIDLLYEDLINLLIENLREKNKVKISKFGTFTIRLKNKRLGRNPKTKEEKIISERKVVLFKPSKEFKEFINKSDGKN
tara:strand:+ start:3411 stop:3713 length:303 start_codon:yes stop_codon:yes gene_type:complete